MTTTKLAQEHDQTQRTQIYKRNEIVKKMDGKKIYISDDEKKKKKKTRNTCSNVSQIIAWSPCDDHRAMEMETRKNVNAIKSKIT